MRTQVGGGRAAYYRCWPLAYSHCSCSNAALPLAACGCYTACYRHACRSSSRAATSPQRQRQQQRQRQRRSDSPATTATAPQRQSSSNITAATATAPQRQATSNSASPTSKQRQRRTAAVCRCGAVAAALLLWHCRLLMCLQVVVPARGFEIAALLQHTHTQRIGW